MDRSYAYWAGYLSEHLRAVLAQKDDTAAALAAQALADFDAWCAQRDGSIPTEGAE
jgi:hypothetical protein